MSLAHAARRRLAAASISIKVSLVGTNWCEILLLSCGALRAFRSEGSSSSSKDLNHPKMTQSPQ
jgi:hypothetical protein